jgi:hypothetical protein
MPAALKNRKQVSESANVVFRFAVGGWRKKKIPQMLLRKMKMKKRPRSGTSRRGAEYSP